VSAAKWRDWIIFILLGVACPVCNLFFLSWTAFWCTAVDIVRNHIFCFRWLWCLVLHACQAHLYTLFLEAVHRKTTLFIISLEPAGWIIHIQNDKTCPVCFKAQINYWQSWLINCWTLFSFSDRRNNAVWNRFSTKQILGDEAMQAVRLCSKSTSVDFSFLFLVV